MSAFFRLTPFLQKKQNYFNINKKSKKYIASYKMVSDYNKQKKPDKSIFFIKKKCNKVMGKSKTKISFHFEFQN